jgi:ATP-binding cassette, subfamily B, bacterial
MSLAFAPHRRLIGAYLGPLKGRVFLLAALIIADIALRLANPQVIRFFIDTTQAGGPSNLLVVASLVYLVAGLLGRILNLAGAYVGLDVGWRATNRMRSDLASHLLRLDMPFHKSHTPGELIERVDGDVTGLADFFAQMLVKLAGNGLLVVAILVLIYRESIPAGLVLTLYTLVTGAALFAVNRIGVRAWAAARQSWADLLGFLEERLGATEDIRGVAAEAHQLRGLDRLMLGLLQKARKGWMANALSMVITNFLFIIGYGMGLAIGAALYLRGEATIGAAFLIVYYIGMLAAPLEEIREQATQLQEATASINRVSELFSLSPMVQDGDSRASLPSGPLAVAFEHVTFRYDDTGNGDGAEAAVVRATVLRDVSFSVAPGRIVGVLGRTGSGKTTLTRLLFRLYDPGSGVVRLAGEDIRDVKLDELRRRVSMVTQDVQLFGASVRENLTLFDTTVSDEEIRAALSELSLADWISAMPGGLDHVLETGGGGMSAGEAQLLAFTRLLLRGPGLIILDEASSRLDSITEHRLERAIDRLLAGGDSTALIIAHRLHTVQRADDILILEEGRVVEFGERTTLAANPSSRFSALLRTGLEEVLQ